MATNILVIGESGTGKSWSLQNLDPKETFLIKCWEKPLPFRGERSRYKYVEGDIEKSNLVTSHDPAKISHVLSNISEQKKEIKNVIIDDFQYIMAMEFFKTATDKGYTKFSVLAKQISDLFYLCSMLRQDLNIVTMCHSEVDENGKTKCKTVGKMLDNQLCVEGLFTIVFNSVVRDGKYGFITQNEGMNIAKAPAEMFEDIFIDNDMKVVLDRVNEYYSEDIPY